jgi:hypothetical protein
MQIVINTDGQEILSHPGKRQERIAGPAMAGSSLSGFGFFFFLLQDRSQQHT